jgi:hypothetical protein
MRRRKRPLKVRDPAPEYTEWIAHRYDPGYYLGGRIHPLLRRRRDASGKYRPNPYGYLLIFGGLTTVLGGAYVPDGPAEFRAVLAIVLAIIALFQFAAGWKLLARRSDDKRPNKP